MLLPGSDSAGGTALTERERLRLGYTLRHVIRKYGDQLTDKKTVLLYGCVISEAAYLAASMMSDWHRPDRNNLDLGGFDA